MPDVLPFWILQKGKHVGRFDRKGSTSTASKKGQRVGQFGRPHAQRAALFRNMADVLPFWNFWRTLNVLPFDQKGRTSDQLPKGQDVEAVEGKGQDVERFEKGRRSR